MSRSVLHVLTVVVLGTWGALCCGLEPDASRTTDHDALRALRARVTEAVNGRDVKALRASLAREFVFTAVDQTVITSEEQLQAYYTRVFDGPGALLEDMRVEPQAEILTRFLGDTVGYCYGTSKDSYTLKGGSHTEMTSRWTATVVKEDGEWRIAAAHAGADFMHNPAVSMALSSGYKLGIGGALLGLLLGTLGTVLVMKSRRT